MTDDRLLKELARVAREQQAKDPDRRWDGLAAAELAPDEIARLRDEAGRSREAAAAWEVFRPLETEFRGDVVRQAKRSLGAKEKRPRAWVRWSLPPALAAAVLAVVFSQWGARRALPSYELRLAGTARVERSVNPPPATAGQLAVFAPGNRFELLLTPGSSAGDQVEARAFVLQYERLEPLRAPPPQRSKDGALRFVGVVGENVLLPSGEFELLVAVGRPRSLPSATELRARLAYGSPVRESRWTAWKLTLRGATTP